jgi:hypothetical protein
MPSRFLLPWLAALSISVTELAHGRITDNWGIEDNLTLLKEMGVAKVAS